MALTPQPLIPASALQTLFPCGAQLTGHGTRAAAFARSSNGSCLSCITLRHTSSLPIWDHTVPPLHDHVLRLPSFAHTPYLPGLSLLPASRPVLHLIARASAQLGSLRDFPSKNLRAPLTEWLLCTQNFVYSISNPGTALQSGSKDSFTFGLGENRGSERFWNWSKLHGSFVAQLGLEPRCDT